jgi:NADH-quinone oxidoreductase subunit M
LPGLANFAGELLVFLGCFQGFQADKGFEFIQIATILSLWGVVISAVYMLRAYRRIFFGGAAGGLFISDPPVSQRLPMILLTAVLLVVGVYPATLLKVVEASFAALGVK